ncbi:unnamed protein product [Oikopleura dioica]|uniref:Coiled-coil domain-containing protein 25 n=1 Tax=Oikopleura dioica TaxID=34765 RepID=E4YG83_OIKDI|nr:unnamed protein product [Oikopleura dioica]
MVFYFTCQSKPDLAQKYIIYMGRDKFENEALIHNGWPEDLWFHVDDLSSAHVYLRLPRGETFESVPEEVVEECASLVKANSIKGCKMSETKIVYTPWENLKKTADMVVGQIGYHNHKRCKYICVKKNADIVKKIEKTRSEDLSPDLQAERLARDAEVLAEQKAAAKKEAEEQKLFKLKCEQEKYAKSYDRLFDDEPARTTNQESENDSDDFM